MNEGLEFADAPVLTLDPFPEKEAIPEEKREPAEPAWDDNILTEEERRMILHENAERVFGIG